MQQLVAEAKSKPACRCGCLAAEQIDRLAGRGVHNGVVAEISQHGYADFDDAIARRRRRSS